MPRSRVLLIAAAALAAEGSLLAQKTPKVAELPPLAENVTVAITNVEVVVTNSKGNRVPGLKKEDFQVFEDGIPQPITNFYAVTGGRTILADGSEISLSSPPAPAAAAEIPAALKAKYVVYVDNLNIHPLHRTRVFRSVYDFLDKAIGPNAEGMVMTFNRSLKVRQKFTSEKGLLVGALEKVAGEAGGGQTIVSEREDALQKINDMKNQGEAINYAEQVARSMDDDLRASLDGLKTAIDGLAGVDGRKILIYVSDGLPQTVGQELFDTIQTKFHASQASTEAFTFDRTASYLALVREANAQGVTLHAIDASGLQADENVSAERATMDSRPSTFFLRQNYQQPLQTLARETGGIAAINTNDPTRELDEVARDFSDFYSLGYRSTRGAVDRPHQIEVKLTKPGLRARYRSGYMEKTVETRTAEEVTAALTYPRSENPLKFTIAVGDPKAYSAENYLVPIRMSIPLENVTLVPDGAQYRGRLYVYFVVLDSDGKQSDLQIRPLEIKVPLKNYDSARTKTYGYDVQLIMIPGAQRLSVAIRDGVSNAVSFAQKGVFISVLPAEKKAGS
ncbi:MAG TPA: VWA domain-containing protein [Thermoanaerobaculia bacterium]|nr:VWA domain-containing protein [Thermoanaerobaculia bacterium]